MRRNWSNKCEETGAILQLLFANKWRCALLRIFHTWHPCRTGILRCVETVKFLTWKNVERSPGQHHASTQKRGERSAVEFSPPNTKGVPSSQPLWFVAPRVQVAVCLVWTSLVWGIGYVVHFLLNSGSHIFVQSQPKPETEGGVSVTPGETRVSCWDVRHFCKSPRAFCGNDDVRTLSFSAYDEMFPSTCWHVPLVG